MLKFLPNSPLILQAALSLFLTVSLSFLSLPAFFLQGIHTYIHPDDVTSSTKAALRRPGSDLDSKPRKKNKERFDFDETKAQIFRVRLTDGHLQTRPYFKEFNSVFNFTITTLCCLLLQNCLSGSVDNESTNNGFVSNGAIVPILLGFVAVFRLVILIYRVSVEGSASKRSDKQLSVALGVFGFVVGLMIVLKIVSFIDFEIQSLDGFAKFLVALLMGLIAGFLFMPSARNARAFWLGTDQIQCSLSIIYCGLIGRMLLYVNYLVIVFTSLLWINPFCDLLINKNYNTKGSKMVSDVDELVGNFGMERLDFHEFRLWCLLISGLVQIFTLRPNLQMYLNEAVLSWYQRLHASKVPDLEYSRAKVFLHNHYLCLTVVQFFVPPALVLLFFGLSRIDGDMFKSFVKQVALAEQVGLLMAWWINFVWALFTSASLLLYRRGALYVS